MHARSLRASLTLFAALACSACSSPYVQPTGDAYGTLVPEKVRIVEIDGDEVAEAEQRSPLKVPVGMRKVSFEGKNLSGTFPIPIKAGLSYRCFPVRKQTGVALRVQPQEGPVDAGAGKPDPDAPAKEK